MLEITIWDENSARLQENYTNLQHALRKDKIQAKIICNSEVPLINRNGLKGTTPVFEFYGNFWRLGNGKVVPTEEFTHLFSQLKSFQ